MWQRKQEEQWVPMDVEHSQRVERAHKRGNKTSKIGTSMVNLTTMEEHTEGREPIPLRRLDDSSANKHAPSKTVKKRKRSNYVNTLVSTSQVDEEPEAQPQGDSLMMKLRQLYALLDSSQPPANIRSHTDAVRSALYSFLSVDDHPKPQHDASVVISHIRELTALISTTEKEGKSFAGIQQVFESYLASVCPPPVTSSAKSAPASYGARTADDLFDLTSEVCDIPPIEWTREQLSRVIERMREVQVFFMRGTPEACQALGKFQRLWEPFVLSRPDIIKLLDPELIIMDIAWAPPAGWAATLQWASGKTPANPISGIAVPPLPAGSPAGAPPAPASIPPGGGAPAPGFSDFLFTTPAAGIANDACAFGGFVTGAHYANVRGFWRLAYAVAPTYY